MMTPTRLAEQVPDFGQNQAIKREGDRLGRARQEEDRLGADEPRGRAAEHGGSANF